MSRQLWFLLRGIQIVNNPAGVEGTNETMKSCNRLMRLKAYQTPKHCTVVLWKVITAETVFYFLSQQSRGKQ